MNSQLLPAELWLIISTGLHRTITKIREKANVKTVSENCIPVN